MKNIIWPVFLLAFLFLPFFNGYGQSNAQTNSKRIEIVSANELSATKKYPGAKLLKGNVVLKHEGVIMKCDSAFLLQNNSLEAFGHVHFNQGDSLQVRGDSLFFDGNTKKAQLMNNIYMNEKNTTLTTNRLDFDVEQSLGYYYGGGRIRMKNNNNTLTSQEGSYHSKSKTFHFRKDVVLNNPNYNIEADTLIYHSPTEIVKFRGPAVIRSKENTIYCERGTYDTKNDKAYFSINAHIDAKTQQIYGDSIFFDRNKGIGEAFCNVRLIDTSNNFELKGDYAYQEEQSNYAYMTGHAELINGFEDDTLYLHADTIMAITDTVTELKSIKAYRHVKFFKPDMQGSCDSLYYSETDSIFNLFHDPYLWSGQNQLSGDTIRLFSTNGSIESVYMNENGFIISKLDSLDLFNQIKGKTIRGLFNNNKLEKVLVNKNGQTVYYATEDNQPPFGMNKATCSDIVIYIKNDTIQQVSFLANPEGKLTPMDQLQESDQFLKGFTWKEYDRPQSKFDIFIHRNAILEEHN